MAKIDRTKETADGPTEYKVTDRRLFTAEGDLRDGAGPPEASEDRAAGSGRDVESPGAGGFAHRPLDEPEGVDFTMLINAMAEPALLFLGEIPSPTTGRESIDLERSRIQIDLLDLLRIKCRGNLSHDEESLLDRVLYQLRMLFVARRNEPRP